MLEKKPEANEFEVSVFGLGFGECILVHFCNDEWLCIDSCRDGVSRRPVALDYLSRLDLDPAKVVRIIVASHWDDDHIRGLAETYSACKAAQFVVGVGLRTKEFLKIVHGLAEGNKESGVDELAQIIQEVKKRKLARPPLSVSPVQFAAQGMILLRDTLELMGGSCTREVTALSPSPSATERSFRRIAGLFPEELQPLGPIPALEPNHTSIVIWVRVAGRAVLLGADLEEVADRTDGWSGILASSGRPREKASLFKIPHHGSSNGHHAHVWENLLTAECVAVLTPFHNGRVRLPTGEDVERICRCTQKSYCAGSVDTRRSEGPNRDANRRLRRLRKEVMRVVRKTGHVRVRGDVLREPHEWTVETYGAAEKIC